MNQLQERIKQLEDENRALSVQLADVRADVFNSDYLKKTLLYNKEVIAQVANDERGSVQFISESIAAYGYLPEEFTQGTLTMLDLVHPEDLEQVNKIIRKKIRSNVTASDLDYRICCKSGQSVWVSSTIMPIMEKGQKSHYLIKISNINKRKKYEAELLDANENLFVTLKSIGESVILTDAEGYVNRLNGSAERFIGVINLKVKNKPLKEVIQFSYLPGFETFVDPFETKTKTGSIAQLDEVFMRCPCGTQYRVSCNISPICLQKNKLAGYVLVIKDLTTVYNLLQTTQESEQALKARLDLLLSEDIEVAGVTLTDIISIDHLQQLQDQFSVANGVSSVITDINNVPITKPSNFNDICTSVYNGKDCLQSDKLINNKDQHNDLCKLVSAKAPIFIGGQLVANWKIGMCGMGGIVAPFVKAVCTDEERPGIHQKFQTETTKHFNSIYHLLVLMANEISGTGYNNLKLARELIRGRDSEARLQESEQTIRSIFDHSMDGIILTDRDGVVVEWSNGYEQMTGISKKKAINKLLWDVVANILPPEHKTGPETDNFKAELIAVVGGMKPQIITRHIIHYRSKERRILHSLFFPVATALGTMMGAIIRDVTDEVRSKELIQQNEQQLMERNALLQGIMKTIPIPLYVKDMSGSYIECNNAFLETFGFTKTQVIGKNHDTLFHRINSDMNEADRLLLSTRQYTPSETKIATVGGITDNIVYRDIFCDDKGTDAGIVSVVLDITDMKATEYQLLAEKERLQALGDNFPNGSMFRLIYEPVSKEMRFGYVSESWKKHTNVSPEDTQRDCNTVFDKVHPADLPVLMAGISKSAEAMTLLDCQIRYCYTPDTEHWLQISCTPHREANLFVWDGYVLNINDRKLGEIELESYREKLEKLVKERTEELEISNEELYATNEELYATNEEFAVINEELHLKNDQLEKEFAARKQIMLQLEDSEKKMRNFIQQSFEGIVILDSEGKILEWNKAQEQISGISRNEAIDRFNWDVLQDILSKADNFCEQIREKHTAYFKAGCRQEPIAEDMVLHLPDDIRKYVQISTFPIGLAETCYFGQITHDITEQKLADIALAHYQDQLEQMVELKTRELVSSQERLISLSNNLPGGVIYQMMSKGSDIWFTYISANFTDMFQRNISDVMIDSTLFFNAIHPDDRIMLKRHFKAANHENGSIDLECRIIVAHKTTWVQMRSGNRLQQEDQVHVWDGFIIDITSRKIAEQELEKTRRRQHILIKVLQIVQSTENTPDAINLALAHIGNYAGVSRAYIFEKAADGKTISNTYEWCREGISTNFDYLQDLPTGMMQDWLNVFESGGYICTSDVGTFSPAISERLISQGVKSILVLPLVANGANYGFMGFDECVLHKEWEQHEIELLISLSQVISAATRRYWAETSIQLSQQTMRTVLDNINANIYVADFDSHEVLFANKKIKEQLGYEIEGQALQKEQSLSGFFPEPKFLEEHQKSTGLYHYEAWNEYLQKWYEYTDAAIEWVDGHLVHMEYATDITDRKNAEEALRKSEELYRQLIVASPDAIVVCDSGGQVLFISPQARELFQINEATGTNTLRIQQYVHSHDRKQAYTMFQKILQGSVSFLPQLLLVREDGSEFFGELSSASVKDDNGHTTSVIMVIRDITERKKSETELIAAKEKAEESDKLKSAFLANMSHEIRTPINGIIGFLNFLADDNLTSKRRQEYITVINNSSTQLVKLIDDIIDVAKIEAKQMNIRPVPLNLNNFMEELQVFFETFLQANNKHKIALILDDSQFISSCNIFVDPMRLRQIVTNLIGNAIKFTEKGYIRFGYKQIHYNMLEFVVEDTGIGLARDQQQIIFERFRQAEETNSRRYGGTGLGLTISRSLVQMMGGDMFVDSSPGEGSSFYFTMSYLPVSPEDMQLFDEPGEAEEAEETEKHKLFENVAILMVEPEIMKRKYYEALLQPTGVSLIYAGNLRQWIDCISKTMHIDVVLASSAIFENENEETIRQVKSVRAGLPLVLTVPECDSYHNELIRNSQCNKVLEGTVDYAVLTGTLKKYIKKSNHN